LQPLPVPNQDPLPGNTLSAYEADDHNNENCRTCS
jgi:hypothetical protein